jgi:hypothetical protein
MIRIEIAPCGHQWAYTTDLGVHGKSRQPFLDACRALVSAGIDPNLMAGMYRASENNASLTGPLGSAARLTVAEGVNDGPRFERWKPFDARKFGRSGDSA